MTHPFVPDIFEDPTKPISPEDPTELKPKKRKPKRITYGINDEEFMKLWKVTTNPKHKVAFLLGYHSGLREAEIINLEKRDFDFKTKRIIVRQGKGSKDRVTNLPKNFKREWISYIPLNISDRALRSAFQRLSYRAGFNTPNYTDKSGTERNKYSFHSLRKGYGTKLLEAGVPTNQVQLMLGHSNIATTSLYVRAREEDALKSVLDLEL